MKVNFSSLSFKANKVSVPQAEYFKKTLKNSKNVDIICHTGTDTDSASCAVVMASYLAQMGVKSRIIASKDISNLGILNPQKYNVIKEKELPDKNEPSTTLCVDFSSKDRIAQKTLDLIQNADKLLCIDHHRGVNLFDHDYTYINSPLNNNKVKSVTSCYVDSSAKSATSIICRIFEALGEDISNENAYNLFLGLADDASKRGYLNCSADTGEIVPTKDAYEDKNFIEVYNILKEKLDSEQVAQIACAVDRTANLTDDENNFRNYLYENVNITPDNKIAFVVIEPDNKLWRKAGGDTPTVSTIMNRFRQDILSNENENERYKDVKVAMVFYKANGNYRVSLHSKDVNLYPIYRYIEDNCPAQNISIGGHTTRGGGRITTIDDYSCNLWVNQVVGACEKNI